MLEVPKPKDLDLIDKKEFRKRLREFNKKHAQEVAEIVKIIAENKVSWGTIVERNAQKYSDKIAVKFEDITFTYKEFNEWVNRYANYFISLGLKKGDVVELMMMNRPEFLITLTALGKIGVISSLINTDLRERSLAHSLKLNPSDVFIVDEDCFNAFNNVKSDLNLRKEQKLFFLPDQGEIPVPDGFLDLSQVVKDFPADNPLTISNVKTSDPIAYVFTSGTTGLPKASILVHLRMVGSYYLFGLLLGELTPEDILYVALPLYHTTGLCVGWAAAFGVGAATAIRRKFSVTHFWDDIRKFNATAFSYVGELCRYLINQPPSPNDSNNPVRTIMGNGLRPDIWMDFKKRFGITRVGEVYGASETGTVFGNYLNFDCTVGYCSNPYTIVKYDYDEEKPMRNEDGFMQKVVPGETGLLLWGLQNEFVFVGYTDKNATEAKILRNVFKEGDAWFNTGDLLRDQGCKHAQFVDRIGDTFRWKAQNVSTTEVEEVLNVFEQILMSSVYGVQISGTDGRAGMASVVISTKIEDFDFSGLISHFRNNLPPYAIPIFLRFKSNLSITATFKFKKVEIKKEGFELENIDDPLYVMLPGESEYTPLTKDIYENIQNKKYKF